MVKICEGEAANGSEPAPYVSPNFMRASLSNPPILDSGLSASSIFSGYKYLGSQYNNTYKVNCEVHRRVDSMDSGADYKFTISPGTSISALAGIIVSAVLSGGASIAATAATGIATMLLGAGIDTVVQGKVSFIRLHYSFKYNCAGKNYFTYKNCAEEEYWRVYREATLVGYEVKATAVGRHLAKNLVQSCNFSVQDYMNGVVTNAACSKSIV